MTQNFDWIQCPNCGLGHARRAEGRCPRCGADTTGDPQVEPGPENGPMPRREAISGFAWDPALVKRVETKPPLPLRIPALLVALYGTVATAGGIVLEEPRLAAASGGFTLLALVVRLLSPR